MLHFGKISKKFVNFGENSATFWQNFGKNCEILEKTEKKTAKSSAIFNENFEIEERCKGVLCVDLDESFPTSIYLQNLASIQPRTSPKKFGKTGKRDFEISFALTPVRAFEIEGQGTSPASSPDSSKESQPASSSSPSSCVAASQGRGTYVKIKSQNLKIK